jgi:signal transduction histidine kinase
MLGIETIAAQQLAQRLAESLPVTIASVALWDRPSATLTIRAIGTARPLDVPLPLWSRVSLATARTHRTAFQHHEAVFVDLEAAGQVAVRDEAALAMVPDLRAIYLLPIRLGDETVGVLGLGEMRSAEREPLNSEKRERCRAILEEFLASSAHAWEAGRLRQQVRAMASLLRMVRETFDVRTSEDALAMCAAEASGWLGIPVRALLFRVQPSGDIAVAARYRFPEPVSPVDAAQIMLALARGRTQSEWPIAAVNLPDDPLDPLWAAVPESGRWTRVSLPLMSAGRLLGLICLYVEEELQLSEWELEAFRHRAEIATHVLMLVSTLEDHAKEQAWVGRTAFEALSSSQRVALREALKGIDRLVETLLPSRLHRLLAAASGADPSRPAEADALVEAVTREVSGLLDGLRGNEAATDGPSGETDLNSLVRRVTSMARASLDMSPDVSCGPVQLSLDLMGEPLVTRSTPDLVAALVHAIENAVEAMPEGGEIRVRTARDNGHALISVQDTGSGVAALEDAFAPLVSTKGKPHMGLGLSILRGVVSVHGGTASLVSSEGGGALLQIRLPLVGGEHEPARSVEDTSPR